MAKRIAIVGAGISGLLAARELGAAGHAVHVFDKARGPGGRLATRRHQHLAFDHGAQYFTVREPQFQQEVAAWLAAGVVATWDARLVTACDGKTEPRESAHVRYVGTPRMSALTRFLTRGREVRFDTRVREIRREEAGWRLRSEMGDLGRFDGVLVTTPPEQAVPLLAAAPELAALAATVRSEACWAVLAAFERRLPAQFDGAFVHDDRLAWAARNNSKPGRPPEETWVLHGSTAWNRVHQEDPAEAVSRSLLAAFFEATGLEPVEPTFQTAHRWLLARAGNPLERGAAFDVTGSLGVCGDWCRDGRVEGAALSGLAAGRHTFS